MSTEQHKRNDKRRKTQEPSDEEKQLQELVFGKDIVAATSERQSSSVKHVIDKGAITVAAWQDDDEEMEVDLHSSARLKKLKRSNDKGETTENTKVSAAEFTQLLQERFQTKSLAWAKVSAGEDGEDDPDNDIALHQTGSMVDNSKDRGGPLPQSRLDVRRCIDANAAEPSKESISAIKFHPSGRMLMAASGDKKIRFFQIDGDKNEKLMSVNFKEMDIHCATFLGSGSEVLVSGRKPYFFSYETTTGAVSKIPGLMGKGLKSHESMAVSPLGTRIAFIGASGYVHIVCGRQKTWQMDVKMNCSCETISFLDEDTLTTSGTDANIYIWDLKHTARCLNRIVHDDGTGSTSLATLSLDPSGSSGVGYMAVGAKSGVVTLYNGDLKARARGVALGSAQSAVGPAVMKSVMNLVTPVTSISYHSSGELVAMASSDKKNQLKMVHLPSCTVFENWPTERTPLNKVTCLDFSPGGAFLAFGENKGRVLLYRLKHFETA